MKYVVNNYKRHHDVDYEQVLKDHRKQLSTVFPFHFDGHEWNRDVEVPRNRRYIGILMLLENVVDVPETTLYIDIGDNPSRKAYNLGIPICSTAFELDLPYFPFPDPDFVCQKIETSCYTWDETKNIAKKKLYHGKKIQQLYYRGSEFGNNSIKLPLEKIVEGNPLFDVKVTSHEKKYEFEPFYNGSKYSYLIDIPDSTGWSPKFKSLFLCNSVVVKGSILKKRPDGTISKPVTQFIDFFLKPGRDYINITVPVLVNDRGSFENEDVNMEEYTRFVRKLEKIGQVNPRKFNEIRDNGYNVVNNLTNEDVYKYIRRIIKHNNQIINY